MAEINRGTMKVLVVDDMSTMRRIVKNLLSQLGFDPENMLEAEDGVQALEVLSKNQVDFVVTDWNMPVMTGIDLLRNIRKTDGISSVPVLMVTAEAKREQVIEAAQAGVNQYIVKPFTAATLEGKLNKIFT